MNLFNKNQITQKTGSLTFIIVLFAFLFLYNKILIAQSNNVDDNTNPRKANISLISRIDEDSVVLRWAPTKAGAWVIANQIGYVVEKLVLDLESEVYYSNYEKLTENPLKPLSLDEWKTKTSKDNMFSAVAAQALYGKLFNPSPTSGGDLNTMRNAADELTNRYSFSLFAADNDAFTADALGLRWVDRDIEKGKRYAYRVYVAEVSKEYSFDTAYIVVDAIAYKQNHAPKDLSYESGDGSIKLSWAENDSYSGYYVYRSDDGGKNYRKLNDLPMVTMTPANAYTEAQPSFLDTTAINYTNYLYQVRGVTAFAELSEAVEIIAMAKDKKAPLAPRINKPEQISGTEIKLSWDMQNPPEDLRGFAVSRSNNSLHGFQFVTLDLLSKDTREYIVNLSNTSQAYFNIAAVDTAGNISFSVPVLASLINDAPPAIPTGLAGEINEKGIVTLSWNPGLESNLAGYRVLRTNQANHEYLQITNKVYKDTIFTDTINIKTLTRRVYYKIAAVNDRFQHSEMSDALELERPDIIPPGEAIFDNVFVTDSSVQLKWHPSASDDLAKQKLLKKLKDETEWEIIDSFPPNMSNYVDKDIKINTMYLYTIIGIDSAGLSSEPAFPVMARPYDSGKRSPVQNLIAEYEQANKTVSLTWNYTPLEKERTWYMIYKAVGEGEFKEHKSVNAATFSYTDYGVKPGSVKYGIVVMTSHGGESEMVTSSLKIDETE